MKKVTIYYIGDDYGTSFSNLSDQEVSRILYQMNNEKLVKIEDDDDVTYYNSDNITAIEVEEQEEDDKKSSGDVSLWIVIILILVGFAYMAAALHYNLWPFNPLQ